MFGQCARLMLVREWRQPSEIAAIVLSTTWTCAGTRHPKLLTSRHSGYSNTTRTFGLCEMFSEASAKNRIADICSGSVDTLDLDKSRPTNRSPMAKLKLRSATWKF